MPHRFRPHAELLDVRTTPAILLTPGSTAGTAADGDTSDELLQLSTDGRYLLFASAASNLVAGALDTNGEPDLFWRDTQTGTTKLVTSNAGTLIAASFGSPSAGSTSVPLARRAVLSSDGQTIAYVSAVPSTQLTGDSTILDRTNSNDVFAWSAGTGLSKLVSVRFGGTDGAVGNGGEAFDPNLSDDGRFVGYASRVNANDIDSNNVDDQDNTLDLFRRDLQSALPTQSTVTATSIPGSASVVGGFAAVERPVGRYLSGDGQRVAFATVASADTLAGVDDGTQSTDVFARDLTVTATSGLVAVSKSRSGAAIGNIDVLSANGPVLSRDGDTVVFSSNAPGGSAAASLVGAYVDGGNPADLYAVQGPFDAEPDVFLVSAVNGSAGQGANGLVPTPGGEADLASYAPTSDGAFVVFESEATNLVPGVTDENEAQDVFVRELRQLLTEVVSVNAAGATGSNSAGRPSISDDGRFVAFVSASPDLDAGVTDANEVDDVFVRDRQLDRTAAASVLPIGRADTGGAASTAAVAGSGMLVFASSAGDLSDPGTPAGQTNLFADTLPLAIGLSSDAGALLVTGPAGGGADVFGFDADGRLATVGATIIPFPDVDAGPPRSAAADVNGDGVTDYVFAVGAGGGSLVRILDGSTREELVGPTQTFEDTFTGGLFVAAADVDNDGAAEVIVSPDVGGGARIQVFKVVTQTSGGSTETVLETNANFFAFPDDTAFRGGARVAAADIDGDGFAEVIVAAGFGGGPRVAIFDGLTLFDDPTPDRLIGDFFAFPGADAVTLRNGTFVSAGDLNGDGRADLAFGGGPGGGPRVYALNGRALVTADLDSVYANPIVNFFAFSSDRRGGVRPAVKDIDGDSKLDLVVGSGDGDPAELRTYLGADLVSVGEPDRLQALSVDDVTLADGVFVG